MVSSGWSSITFRRSDSMKQVLAAAIFAMFFALSATAQQPKSKAPSSGGMGGMEGMGQPKPTAMAPASSNAPVSDAIKAMMQRMARNLPAAADDMSVAKFNYRPTPAQLRFGDVVIHLAE